MTVKAEKGLVLQGVVFREGDMWVARCLTIDHAAQGPTRDEAIKACVGSLLIDIRYAIEHDSLEHLRPAPVSDLLEYQAQMVKPPVACRAGKGAAVRGKVRGRSRTVQPRSMSQFSRMFPQRLAAAAY